jgi:hypothetical protein
MVMNRAKRVTTGVGNKLHLVPSTTLLFDITIASELIGPVSSLEFNHVLYQSVSEEGFKMSLLDAFDSSTWICIGISFVLLIISNLTIDYATNRSNSFNKLALLSSYINFYFNSMIASLDHRCFPSGNARVLAASWLLALIFLFRFFTSDTHSLLSIKVPDKVIDSIEELCAKKDVRITLITLRDTKESNKYKEGIEVKRCIANRIEFFDIFEVFLDEENKRDFFMGINNGEHATMMEMNIGNSIIESFKNEMPNLYLSKHGIDSEPFYLRFISTPDEQMESLLARIIKQTTETGVFIKWIRDVDKTRSERRKVEMEYLDISLQMLSLIFMYYLYACIFCTIIFSIEIMLQLIERSLVWLKQFYQKIILYLFFRAFFVY